ncbi:hypothetical protein RJ639_000559 [Escallonia herrerae]|uniref:Uncharacterized protein n=1 Tax=Escallonia herrerae TaxID=1293975 RepID=A0AA89BIR9_9ASTE|nr:hypothetical protein RJ639_000559 [Escallonia herrerae]
MAIPLVPQISTIQLTLSFELSADPSIPESRILRDAITALLLLPHRNKISPILLTKALEKKMIFLKCQKNKKHFTKEQISASLKEQNLIFEVKQCCKTSKAKTTGRVTGLDPKSTARLFEKAQCLGEKQMGDEDYFVLKVAADRAAVMERNEGPAEVLRHVLYGYFSQKSGLLIYIKDSHLTRVSFISPEYKFHNHRLGASLTMTIVSVQIMGIW